MDTSDLVVAQNPDAVLILGDNQYECGQLEDFNGYFDPSWGRFKTKTHPAIGNHEYTVSTDPANPCYNAPAGAPGYWSYFGPAANPADPACIANCKGYYSYNIGSWHIVAINSVCSKVSCSAGSAQEQWLRADLAAHPAACTLAYWHHPLFSSGKIGNNAVMAPIWQALYDAGVDVVLAGHDHHYERFAPQDAAGNADSARGIREFIVGTGGRNVTPAGAIMPNSEVRNFDTFGVLKLTLHPTGYTWQFVPQTGSAFTDTGEAACH